MNDPLAIIFTVIFGVLVLAAVLALYFLPYIIARKKNHPNRRAIFWVNLLLGGTGGARCADLGNRRRGKVEEDHRMSPKTKTKTMMTAALALAALTVATSAQASEPGLIERRKG